MFFLTRGAWRGAAGACRATRGTGADLAWLCAWWAVVVVVVEVVVAVNI